MVRVQRRWAYGAPLTVITRSTTTWNAVWSLVTSAIALAHVSPPMPCSVNTCVPCAFTRAGCVR